MRSLRDQADGDRDSQAPEAGTSSIDFRAPATIGVAPTREATECETLFAALEQAYPVVFESIDRLAERPHAALVAGPEHRWRAPAGVPRLVLGARADARSFGPAVVKVADDGRVQRPLRGRELVDEDCSTELPLAPPGPDAVLASVARTAVWWQAAASGTYESASSYPLPPLGDAPTTLRDHFKAGRFMALLPLLHLIDAVLGPSRRPRAPLRASFVIDDPNLHWPTYGFVDYAQLAEQADRHGFHVGLAMVPLDGWFASRRASSSFTRGSLSLLMHGNDHRKHELARLSGVDAAAGAIAQAIRRTAAFERRVGVPVQRVVVPPHEVCSRAVLDAMFMLGLDGVCVAQRYPWRTSSAAGPPMALARWHPTDMVAGGLPILPRHPLAGRREDLVFRALLGQPLILYGHHDDLSEGIDVLSEAASAINGLGEVSWEPLGRIARQMSKVWRGEESLVVQMHSRRCVVRVPADVAAIEVRSPSLCAAGAEPAPALRCGAGVFQMRRDEGGWTSGALPATPGASVSLALESPSPLDASAVGDPGASAWVFTRRALAEVRDRLAPLGRNARRAAKSWAAVGREGVQGRREKRVGRA
jgi:hypothetical protein